MKSSEYFDWSKRNIARLEQLWADGLSTAAIGRQLGCSKNSVVSKARITNCPPRPNPIHKAGEPKAPKPSPLKAKAKTLPAMGPLTIAHAGIVQPVQFVRFDDPDPKYPRRIVEREAPIVDDVPVVRERDERVSDIAPLPAFHPRMSRHDCQYPTDNPRTGRIEFVCDKPAYYGPYCDEHRAICWVPGKGMSVPA